jgi:hypothetical protein
MRDDEDMPDMVGWWVFTDMVNGHSPEFMERMRQPHPDFPVSKKSGSVFEEKENN